MRHSQWPELTIEDVLRDERPRPMPNLRPFDGRLERFLRELSVVLRRARQQVCHVSGPSRTGPLQQQGPTPALRATSVQGRNRLLRVARAGPQDP
ncbi:MAG: hypothetical protein E6Q76_04475 [Rhizobium sp.]|nr:MAG: hypothetical protein E6Q76_04475 [Rhizobium sp.]